MNATERAVDLFEKGRSIGEIALTLGISTKTVAQSIQRARRRGLLSATSHQAPVLRATGPVSGGYLLLKDMPKDISKWVMSQVPEGANVGDVLKAIVTDAYFEHKSGR